MAPGVFLICLLAGSKILARALYLKSFPRVAKVDLWQVCGYTCNEVVRLHAKK